MSALSTGEMEQAQAAVIEPSSEKSPVPLLGEGFTETTLPVSAETVGTEANDSTETSQIDPATGKRRLWNLGTKKEDRKTPPDVNIAKTAHLPAAIRPILPAPWPNSPSSPPHNIVQTLISPASPGRIGLPSPRLDEPAPSEIFERSVQEDGLVATVSPAIPSHITTENYIPPVLDASSMAITDGHLNPDNVEIVTHAAHQSAVATFVGASPDIPSSPTLFHEEVISNSLDSNEDTASNYGTLDSTDVRRLSFISFADVVHAEHAEHSAHPDHGTGSIRESILLHSPGNSAFNSPTLGSGGGGYRSPSPMRSPVSPSPLSASLTSASSFSRGGHETSPNRGTTAKTMVPASPRMSGYLPPAPHSPPGNELMIETMRQTLRKTGSGDLSGRRSPSLGPTSIPVERRVSMESPPDRA